MKNLALLVAMFAVGCTSEVQTFAAPDTTSDPVVVDSEGGADALGATTEVSAGVGGSSDASPSSGGAPSSSEATGGAAPEGGTTSVAASAAKATGGSSTTSLKAVAGSATGGAPTAATTAATSIPSRITAVEVMMQRPFPPNIYVIDAVQGRSKVEVQLKPTQEDTCGCEEGTDCKCNGSEKCLYNYAGTVNNVTGWWGFCVPAGLQCQSQNVTASAEEASYMIWCE